MTHKTLALGLILTLLFGCGDSKVTTLQPTEGTVPAPTYNNPAECQQLQFNTGVPGNVACPYGGQFDPRLGYQGWGVNQYGEVQYSYEYRDLCPQQDHIVVIKNGEFSHCEALRSKTVTVPRPGHRDTWGSGECVGNQYNLDATGCLPRF